MEASALWIMGLPWGSWEGGCAQRRMSYLGEQEANWTGRGSGEQVYVGYLKAGSLQGDSERDPASNFPLPFPEQVVQGLEECPWSVGPVLSVIHLSVPTFK